MNDKNPFDFTDTSDLPEDIAARLTVKNTSTAAQEWAAVVAKAHEFGFKFVDINQIMAGAHRMGMEVPTQQTVRDYLNRAVALGLLIKPSRQSYALPKRTKAEDAGAGDILVTGDVPADAINDDPLADILAG